MMILQKTWFHFRKRFKYIVINLQTESNFLVRSNRSLLFCDELDEISLRSACKFSIQWVLAFSLKFYISLYFFSTYYFLFYCFIIIFIFFIRKLTTKLDAHSSSTQLIVEIFIIKILCRVFWFILKFIRGHFKLSMSSTIKKKLINFLCFI